MIKLSDNALKTLQLRYLRRDEYGVLAETPEELFRRVAKAIAAAESKFGNRENEKEWEEEFFNLMSTLTFLPNSPTLMNAGLEHGQLSACYVLPVEDSMEPIFETLKDAALIQQSGGGTGFNFSNLRPEGDYLSHSGGTASGPVSFMKIFDAATQHIKQGGRRRGANMGVLNVDHPDIIKFITSKKESGTLNNFNISVGITDAFMEAVNSGYKWELKHPLTRKIVHTINALELWQLIINSAWETGDPGLVFLDEIDRGNPTPGIGRIECTNPCGEVPLLPYEACNLGSFNLSKMLTFKDGKADIDWEKIKNVTHRSIRFLDNVIEVNNYIIPEIEKMVKGNRKIGLGVMGWADMLIQLGIPYDSEEAIALGDNLMSFINEESFKASAELAQDRGVFPNWDKSIYFPDTPIRNATRTSIAPTGTISILANTTSSIEPVFALVFERKNVLNGEVLPEVNQLFLDKLVKLGYSKEDVLKQLRSESEKAFLDSLPKEILHLFPTALGISTKYHIGHQVAFQKHTDNAVSKTINLPESATVKDVEDAYLQAWRHKAKGITIYRYNSKHTQVLNTISDSQHIPSLMQDGIGTCKVCVE